MDKILILGKMPKGADPKTYLAAGPWCFADQEELWPNFASQLKMLPEPLENYENLKAAIRQTKALTASLLPQISEFLAPNNSLGPKYWETLLLPWLLQVTQQIVERFKRLQAIITKYSDIKLTIPILDLEHTNFNFANESEFTLHGALGLEFNHYIFSYLLTHSKLPKNFTLEVIDGLNLDFSPKSQDLSLIAKFKLNIKKTLRKLPVPHLKGLSLAQSLLFSYALNHPSLNQDHSWLLEDQGPFEKDLKDLNLSAKVLDIAKMALPRSIANLNHPKKLKPSQKPKIRIASIEAYEDSQYRQELAIFRGQGNFLVFVQHGGNYGQIRYSCLTEVVEYSQQAFITWGWREHEGAKGNFIPLPYPQLAKLAKIAPKFAPKSDKALGKLLMIGTEMPLLGYRLDSHPTPMQIISYREAKIRFLLNLPLSLQRKTLYRPYFKVPTCLEDAPYIKRQCPNIQILTGTLTNQMLAANLLVLDHHGTSLLEAMASNIPLLLYWNPNHWPVTPSFEAMLADLKDVGVWFDNPEECAAKVSEIFDKARDWWQNSHIQAVRQAFCKKYAQIIKPSENTLWMRTLKTL